MKSKSGFHKKFRKISIKYPLHEYVFKLIINGLKKINHRI